MIARSIFEKEAPYQRTEKANKISTYEAYEESHYVMTIKEPHDENVKRKRNSESESRCIPYRINLDEYSSIANPDEWQIKVKDKDPKKLKVFNM